MRESLVDRLCALFARGVDAPLSEAEFNALALEVFAHQFARNRPYSLYCAARTRTPDSVSDWREVPALHASAFKEIDLTTVARDAVRVEYRTSGTTRGTEKPGRHLLPDTRLYDASLLPNFQAHLLPDRPRIRMLVCGPTAEQFPHSSLGHMNSRVIEAFGAPGSGVFWGAEGPRFPELSAALRDAVAQDDPVCLLGTAFGFVNFLEWLPAQGSARALPEGSRIMDTGGCKGRVREVPKAELYAAYERRLGVPPTHVVNEYGMTELGSQFYDSVLREWTGAGRTGVRCKHAPPWARVLVVDPETLEPLPAGHTGLLRFFDLANLHSVAAVQTDDLGVELGDGFEILGRASGAEPRGCSLTAEDLQGA